MRESYSIQEIGWAISNICQKEPSTERIALPEKASILAECYGMMIYLHQEHISATDLSEAQIAILDEVFGGGDSGGVL